MTLVRIKLNSIDINSLNLVSNYIKELAKKRSEEHTSELQSH